MGRSFRRLIALVIALNLGVAGQGVAAKHNEVASLYTRPSLERLVSQQPRGSTPLPAVSSGPRKRPVRLPCRYVVQRGDSLSSVASRFLTVPQAIMRANGLKNPDVLETGRSLWIRQPVAAEVKMQVVAKGDTVRSLARKHGLSPAALCAMNGIPAAHSLKPGQQVLVPAMTIRWKASVSRSVSMTGVMAGLTWPISGQVTSVYGWRWGRMHMGLDLAASTGTPVKAAAAGRVTFAGTRGGYGLLVIIDHGGGWETYYAHNSVILVSVGQLVCRGGTIAEAGSSGHATGSHLHFEVRHGAKTFDPVAFLPRS